MGANQSKTSAVAWQTFSIRVHLLVCLSRHRDHRGHPIWWCAPCGFPADVRVYSVAWGAVTGALEDTPLEAELLDEWHPRFLTACRRDGRGGFVVVHMMDCLWDVFGEPPQEGELFFKRSSYDPDRMTLADGKPCGVCGVYGARKMCGRCGARRSCDYQCQLQDWGRHRSSCIGAKRPRGY